MSIRSHTLAAAIALLSLGTLATAPTPAQAQIYVQIGPPAPRVEQVPPPRRGYVWSPGHWEWRGNQHVWIQGNYLRARPGYAYRPAEWHQRGDRWEMQRGGWDQDRRGRPDRHDKHKHKDKGRGHDDRRHGDHRH